MNKNTKEQSCEHIYGHSSLFDSLIYDLKHEKKCLDGGQLYDCTYPYTIFLYCPICGIKLKRV